MSVPRAAVASPAATATAEPELEPPLTRSGSSTLAQGPYGERLPVRPVANWSMLVLPTTTAPASTSRCTTGAEVAGR